MLNLSTDLSALGLSLTLSYLIYISLGIINSRIVRLKGYVDCFFVLLIYPRQNIALMQ
jgi:hypothetical protein